MLKAHLITRCVLLHLALMSASYNERAVGQEWVRAMFEEKEHDFGTVPRGAAASFEFKLVNKYLEPVHIVSARSSCGCTTPRIKKADLKTYEEGAIICEFNTTSFIGPKSAVVTVVFDRPFYGEMQLVVKGNIRSDILTEPGIIEFGDVDLGTSKGAKVQVSYQGTKDWKVKDVRSENRHLGVKLTTNQSAGRTTYTMDVFLKETAPPGEFNDQVVLVTNEEQFNYVTIPVRGNVLPPVSLPASVELGTVKTGSVVDSRLIVKSKEACAITAIECPDGRFVFQVPDGKKNVHIVPFKFIADEKSGGFRQRVTVTTDLGVDSQGSTLISGNVVN
jgi:hypothetical protein